MSDPCPKCGGDTRCLAGHSAHPDNWYCKDESGCGWRAWENRYVPKEVEDTCENCKALQARIDELEALLKDRDGDAHDYDCKERMGAGDCTCMHDEVVKYFTKHPTTER